MLGATVVVALSATAAAVWSPDVAAAAGVDALQVVRVRPSSGTVELLVAVPERYTGVTIPPSAFALDGGQGPVAPLSATPVPAARSPVAVVLDNRAVISPPDLLTAQATAVELFRGLEDGTPFAVVTTARPAVMQGPTTDKDAASEAIRSVARSGSGSLSDGVSAALAGVGGDAVAPALALFTAGGQGAGPELSAQAAAAGAMLTELDATGVQPAALLPAVDELTGTLTGRQLLTFPAWGTGQATLSLSLDGRRYEAAVDLPPDAGSARSTGSGASQGALPADAKAPPQDLRPSQTSAPAPVRPSPASGSTSSGGDDRSRSLLFSIAAALAAVAILGAGLTINRRERRARRRGALRPLGEAADGRPNEALPRLASGTGAAGAVEPEVADEPAAVAAALEQRDEPDEAAELDEPAAGVAPLDAPVEPESPEPEPEPLEPLEPEAHEPEPEADEPEPEPERGEPSAAPAAAARSRRRRPSRTTRRPTRPRTDRPARRSGPAPREPRTCPRSTTCWCGPRVGWPPAAPGSCRRPPPTCGHVGIDSSRHRSRSGPGCSSSTNGATWTRWWRTRSLARRPLAVRWPPSDAARRCPCATPGAASTASGCCPTFASSTAPTCPCGLSARRRASCS